MNIANDDALARYLLSLAELPHHDEHSLEHKTITYSIKQRLTSSAWKSRLGWRGKRRNEEHAMSINFVVHVVATRQIMINMMQSKATNDIMFTEP